MLAGLRDPVFATRPALPGVVIDASIRDGVLWWSVTNDTDDVVALDAVDLVGRLGPVGGDPRMLVHGYQSWSPTGVRRIGVDADPSPTTPFEAVRGAYHADPDPTSTLRSEAVTVVDLDTGAPRLAIGFEAATDHDGTIRVGHDGGELRVTVEAWLDGIRLDPGTHLDLHPVRLEHGDDPSALLEAWATRIGAAQDARARAPYRVGWCSWYHYFHEITEHALRANLARATDWPFDVFQVDDGYQRSVGDWLATGEGFPSDLSSVADAIRRCGMTAGIWLAPFVAHLDSEIGRAHPEWFARERTDPDTRRTSPGDPLVGGVSDHWGGFVHTLDTTNPEVLAHLEATAAALVDAGFEYLKLDFTYAPSLRGRYRDPTRTPAQRVRAGYDAIRRGAGGDAYLLGCGAPLGPCIGVVDGMRIGPDVAPHLHPEPGSLGYPQTAPALMNAWRSTLARSFMHRRLWVNDPDCLLLRDRDTDLPPAAARSWATAVAMSGGLATVSDDLTLLGDEARGALDEVTARGRAVDATALDGAPPRCPDLLARPTPARLRAGGHELVGTPEGAGARLR